MTRDQLWTCVHTRTPGRSLLPYGQFISWQSRILWQTAAENYVIASCEAAWQSPGGRLRNLSTKVHRRCSMLIGWLVISVGAGDSHGHIRALGMTWCSVGGYAFRNIFHIATRQMEGQAPPLRLENSVKGKAQIGRAFSAVEAAVHGKGPGSSRDPENAPGCPQGLHHPRGLGHIPQQLPYD